MRELVGRPAARAGRARVHRRPHARPHPGIGDVPARRTPVPRTSRGDVLGRPAVRRLHRPHRPARAATTRRCCAAWRRRCCRSTTGSSCSPATDRRPRSGASGRPTPTCTARSTLQPMKQLTLMSRPTPLSGFPELLPAERNAELAVIDTFADVFELHGYAEHRDPRGRAARPAAEQGCEIDKEVYVLRRLQADDEASDAGRRPALRPDCAVRAVRPRERRQARVPVPPLPDPEGLARRTAPGGPVSASSPRPTSTSSPRTSCPSTTTSRWRA